MTSHYQQQRNGQHNDGTPQPLHFEPRRKQQQQAERDSQNSTPTLQTFFTSSTIYNRHEARRAKTLQKANDTRPALVRVIEEITGPQPFLALASSTTNASADHRKSSLNAPEKSPSLNLFEQFSNEDNGSTIFTSYNPMLASNRRSLHQTSTSAQDVLSRSPWIIVLSAATGAKLTDLAFQGSAVSSRNIAPTTVSSTSRQTWQSSTHTARLPPTLPTFMVRQEGSALSVFLHPKSSSSPQNSVRSASETMLNRLVNQPNRVPFVLQRNSLMITPSPTQQRTLPISPSMLPAAILFGTQALVERRLLSSFDDSDLTAASTKSPPLSAASLIASSVAGAAVALVQHGGRPSSTEMSAEVMASVLYFGSYRLLKSALTGGETRSVDPNNASSHGNSLLAIGMAGAMAGTLAEMVRGNVGRQFLLTTNMIQASPFAARNSTMMKTPLSAYHWKLICTRAAPAHALFFLGYEAALGLLAPSDSWT